MANIAVVTQRLYGHIIPILGVCEELSKRGHNIHILAHKSVEGLIPKIDNIFFHQIGWDKYPEMYINEMVNDIYQVMNKIDINLIINDSAQAAPAIIAEKLNVKWVSFQTTVPLKDEFIPGNPKVNQYVRKKFLQEINDIRRQYDLQPLDDWIRSRGDLVGLSPYLHLISVIPQLIGDFAFIPESSKIVGPCHPTDKINNPVKQKSNILVCTTSSTNIEFRDITFRYIKKIIEFFNGFNESVVVAGNTPYHLNEPPKNVIWDNSPPNHHKYLPSSKIVITHGGSGTLQKIMKYGVPMVIIPLGLDQQIIAQRCKELGVATVVEDFDNFLDITSMAKELLENNKFKKDAISLANEINLLTPNSTSSDYIEKLI